MRYLKNMRIDRKEFFPKHYASMTALFVFVVYLFTVAPCVVQIDSGELAAVQATLGIAHPTGYPLFTIIGYIFLKLPLPFTKIFQANLLAAFWCALGVFLFIKSAYLILDNFERKKESSEKNNNQWYESRNLPRTPFHLKQRGIIPNLLACLCRNEASASCRQVRRSPDSSGRRRIKKKAKTERALDDDGKNLFVILSSVCAGIILSFSKTFWFQSTSVEVYSLQIFLFTLIIYTTLHAYLSVNEKLMKWIWAALALALGFANHMTTLLTLPFLAILFFQKEKFSANSFRKIFFMLSIFIPVLTTFYLYLPLCASANPMINWGNPINIENSLRHVSGKQYQVWLFASLEAAEKQLAYFLKNFAGEFGYVGVIIGLIGIISSFKISAKIFYALISTFLFTVLYSINYDIVDIDSYFLLAYIVFCFFAAFGFLKFLFYLKQKFEKKIAIGLVVLISFFPFVLNFSEVNQSSVYTFEDYTRVLLNSTEKNSIVFSYQWDYFISQSYYFQSVENFRADVVVIDKELLRRSWYYNQLKRNHPDVIKNIAAETNNFLEAVRSFERNEQYDPNVIETSYRLVMRNLAAKNIEKRNFYIGPELFQNEMQRNEFSLPEGYQIVPHLLLFKVVKGADYVPAPDPNFTLRFPEKRNKYINFIETTTAAMLTYRAVYELQFNKPERAKIYIEKVKKDFPNYRIPYDIASRFE